MAKIAGDTNSFGGYNNASQAKNAGKFTYLNNRFGNKITDGGFSDQSQFDKLWNDTAQMNLRDTKGLTGQMLKAAQNDNIRRMNQYYAPKYVSTTQIPVVTNTPVVVPDNKFDGSVFTPKNKESVKEMQKTLGVKADGILGPITLGAMNQAGIKLNPSYGSNAGRSKQYKSPTSAVAQQQAVSPAVVNQPMAPDVVNSEARQLEAEMATEMINDREREKSKAMNIAQTAYENDQNAKFNEYIQNVGAKERANNQYLYDQGEDSIFAQHARNLEDNEIRKAQEAGQGDAGFTKWLNKQNQ